MTSKASNPNDNDPPIPVELVEGCRFLDAPLAVGPAKFARNFFYNEWQLQHLMPSTSRHLWFKVSGFIFTTLLDENKD